MVRTKNRRRFAEDLPRTRSGPPDARTETRADLGDSGHRNDTSTARRAKKPPHPRQTHDGPPRSPHAREAIGLRRDLARGKRADAGAIRVRGCSPTGPDCASTPAANLRYTFHAG